MADEGWPALCSPYAAVLTALRDLRRVRQGDLARDWGRPASELSRIENDRLELTYEELREAVGLLGYPPTAIAATLAWRETVLGLAAEPGPVAPSPEEAAARFVGEQVTAAVRRACQGGEILRQKSRARRAARARWAAFARRPWADRLALVQGVAAYRSWAFCERLAEESTQAASDRADKALELAFLAVTAAERTPGPGGWRRRLTAHAWAFLGNALRVGGDLSLADDAFAVSRNLWERGVDPIGLLDPARRLDLEASLRIKQDRFAAALQLLEEALDLAPVERQGALFLLKANLEKDRGNHEAAVATLRQAGLRISEGSSPRLAFALVFNLANNLWHLGHWDQGWQLLPEIRRRAEALGSALDLTRTVWLEARLRVSRGEPEAALPAFEQVRRELCHRRIAYDAALVTLELAELYLDQGSFQEVKALAAEMVWIFQEQGVEPETRTAAELFCQAVWQERVTVALLQQLARDLRGGHRQPEHAAEEGSERPGSR